MFEATTHDVRVEVRPHYDENQSDPRAAKFLFSYHIRITNSGTKPLRLVRRHWIVTDAFGKVEEVEGAGVVGRQPTLPPGATFEYSSFCPLSTPTGTMKGTYAMETETGESLKVEIPQFELTEPAHVH